MGEIGITLRQQWNFSFEIDDFDTLETKREHCCYCGVPISKIYSYIINCLKEGNLLDKDYKLICCYCKVLKRFGLIDLRNKLDRIFYSEAYDILNLQFVLKKYMGKLGILYILYIRIHDYSKIREV